MSYFSGFVRNAEMQFIIKDYKNDYWHGSGMECSSWISFAKTLFKISHESAWNIQAEMDCDGVFSWSDIY